MSGTFDLVRVSVPIVGLPGAFEGLVVGQISDLHIGRWLRPEQLNRAICTLDDCRPDIVVVTGDLADGASQADCDLLATALSRLSPPLGGYVVLGNHEYWSDPERITGAITRSGMTLLRNEHVALSRHGDRMFIAGVDDFWVGRSDLSQALAGIPVGERVLLLAHEPDFAELAARDPRVVLQLSGHGHGGQLRLPLVGALFYPRLARKYGDGLQRVGRLYLYSNRGLGVSFPPLRINCPAEITLLELIPQGC